MKSTYIIIMAGGIGSRFWPASTEEKPKQFLDILGIGKSLLRLTFERFVQIVPANRVYVLTNKKYRDLVKKDLPELTYEQILGEPSRNNTAPCIAYSAFKMIDLDPEANLVIAPSDHFIAQETKFLQVIQQGLAFTASQNVILTLGMKPSRPATGYGYIELGNHALHTARRLPPIANHQWPIKEVQAFKEKPDLNTAEEYIQSGQYVWNSGLFLFKASTILDGFKKHAGQIFDLLASGKEYYNTEKEEEFLAKNYPQTENISIDYAIMERADNIYCLPADFGWTDLGSWKSLYEHLIGSEENVILNGSSMLEQSSGNLVWMRRPRKIILKDIQNYMILDEEDILLIYPLDEEQEIKNVANRVKHGGK